MLPVTDSDNLGLAVLSSTWCSATNRLAVSPAGAGPERFFLGNAAAFLDRLLPRNSYSTGTKKDVPKNACYVGRYC